MKLHIGATGVRRLILHLVTVAALGSTSALFAQTTPIDDSSKDKKIDMLLQKINDLETAQKVMQEKIDRLSAEPKVAGPAPAPDQPTPPAPVPVAAVGEAGKDSDNASEQYHTLGPLQFQGFSDFSYGKGWFDVLPPGGLGPSMQSFSLGDFDIFTNTRISEHWSVLGELLVTSDFSNGFSAELDRLMLTYKQSKYFAVSFGKFNTALGYYPNAFHRAQYFQTGIGRPIMYGDEDDGGILPIHSIGITATGGIPSGSLGLHWVAEVANGRDVNPSSEAIENFTSYKNGKAVNLALYVRPEWLHGLQAGFSSYRDTLYLGSEAFGESIFTAHVVYVGQHLEWLNEASIIRYDLKSSREVLHAPTAYAELAWTFGKTRPYFRYDYQNVGDRVPVFGILGRQNGPSIGVNRRLSNYVALKIQYGHLTQTSLTTANNLEGQLAFAF
jgi:hypothetical protein